MVAFYIESVCSTMLWGFLQAKPLSEDTIPTKAAVRSCISLRGLELQSFAQICILIVEYHTRLDVTNYSAKGSGPKASKPRVAFITPTVSKI